MCVAAAYKAWGLLQDSKCSIAYHRIRGEKTDFCKGVGKS